MIRIHPPKTRLPPTALGALAFTWYCCADQNPIQSARILRAAQPSAQPHTSTRTWPVPAPLQNCHFSLGCLRPAPATCPQMYQATDRCRHSSPEEICPLPKEQTQPARATGEYFRARPFHPPATGDSGHFPAIRTIPRWCDSRSYFRRNPATPKRPSTPR